jgi:vitamin B12 transporter
VFRRDSEDLIDFVSCFGRSDGICTDRPIGTYDNIGRVRAQGIELEGAIEVVEALRLQGVYSYVDAKNRTNDAPNEGNDLARRPRHAATFSADWTTPWVLELGADVRIVSGSYDDAANLTRLGGYAVVTLRAALPIGDTVELFGRVENLFDEDYRTAAGYGTPGHGAYIGARARF